MAHGTFILGLGGQKCGSSWIRAYLHRQPTADFGRLGEYQVWESDLGGVFARYKVARPAPLERLRGGIKRRLGAAEPAAVLRWRMQADRTQYFAYFAERLAAQRIRLTGDITPSYAALDSKTLARIRDGMAAHGIETRIIFAMRDPVERLRSHLNMDRAKGYTQADLAAFYATDEAEARSRYDRTLDTITAVFPPEAVHLCLFETLFTPDGITALAEFAGVAADTEAGAERVNARSGSAPVDAALSADIARHYAPVYTRVAEVFPQISELWPSARVVLG